MKVFIYRIRNAHNESWRLKLTLDISVDAYLSAAFTETGAYIEMYRQKLTVEQVSNPGTKRKLLQDEQYWRPVTLNLDKPAYDHILELADEARLQAFFAAIAGRRLLVEELIRLMEHHGFERAQDTWPFYVQAGVVMGKLSLQSGMLSGENGAKRCRRCGSTGDQLVRTNCYTCGNECMYCSACLQMGRISRCTLLIASPIRKTELIRHDTDYQTYIERYGLSPAQSVAAREALIFLDSVLDAEAKQKRISQFLFWAVTGAGKTEMIFPVIDRALHTGRRLAIATPRKDVVVELAPRLQKAFQQATIVVLYGGSTQTWERGDVVLATTHQLLRFYHAFDLLVIDELDAFPYHNNPLLQYAAHESIRPGGVNMFLSATPPTNMQEQIRAGELAHVRVPVRFHRHPLPVPKRQHPWLANGLSKRVKDEVKISLERGAQVFVFVPEIARVEVWRRRLEAWFASSISAAAIGGTSSQDAERSEKVQAFRDRTLRVLVTTTILERGVTIPKSDVLIVEADHRLFEEAALVQMAGRAGRHPDDPAGRVVFISMYRTQEQKKAIRQIRTMNRLAKKGGYLRSP